ncbi:MAG: hypothetical protein DBP00_09000 [gamma proteobacterium symbiont of Ctena orbiculata]|nr:MAG: hypothetical protein DBP00_09000 [gamma proteobacterium symbiont of Ctena orbiculata]
MSKDVENFTRFSFNSRSFSRSRRVISLLAICSAFILLTTYVEVVRTENNTPSGSINDSINPQHCNKEISATSQISREQKRQNRNIKTAITGPVNTTYNCLIPVETVHEDWKRGINLLIDVRDAKAFDRNKIPGSINLPLYTLKFKKSLLNRKIVLLNKGVHLSVLEKSCLELKALGFKRISVMHDGLKAWNDAGYPFTGATLTRLGFSELTPSEFVSVINERDWAFIDLDHSSKELPNLLSPPSVIEYSEDFAVLRGKMDAFKAARKPGVLTGFLVVSQDGTSNRTIKRRLLDFGIKDVYYLSGGVSGFKRYMQEHVTRIERLRKGFQVRMGCNG